MTPSDETFLKRWTAVRARGIWHFVVMSGVIGWGVPMFFLMSFVVSKPAKPTVGLFAELAAWWVFGGVAFGVCVWLISERRYRRLAPPNAGGATNGVA